MTERMEVANSSGEVLARWKPETGWVPTDKAREYLAEQERNEEQIAAHRGVDVALGLAAIAAGLGCVIGGTWRPHAAMPVWSYGLAMILVGALLVRAGRR